MSKDVGYAGVGTWNFFARPVHALIRLRFVTGNDSSSSAAGATNRVRSYEMALKVTSILQPTETANNSS